MSRGEGRGGAEKHGDSPDIIAVVGTDTGVGKTLVAGALLSHLSKRGFSPAPFKPFASGPSGPDSDAEILRGVLDEPPAYDLVSPCRFKAPKSPYSAVLAGERPIDWDRLEEALGSLSSSFDPIVVEGIGGVMCPLEKKTTWLDYHAGRAWPSIVVGRGGLGTLNHTLLTLDALMGRGIPVLGFILSEISPPLELGPTGWENAAVIGEITGLKNLGVVPGLSSPSPGTVLRHIRAEEILQ